MKSLVILIVLLNISICVFARVHNHEHDEKSLLLPSAVSEGKCKCLNAPPKLNYTLIAEEKTFYMPMASAHAYRLYAEILLGRPAKCYEELEDMCIVSMWAHGIITISGFGRMYTQKCYFDEDNYGIYKCKPNFGTTGTNIGKLSHSVGTFMLSHVDHDGDDWYYLLVRCINGKTADWELASSSPKVSDRVAARITKKVAELGFNKDLVMRLPCKQHEDDKKSAIDSPPLPAPLSPLFF